jgi:predicted amidohydrolase
VCRCGPGYLGKYRKMHIPDDPRYYEKYYFTPGDLGFKVFHTKPVELGVLVCWDQWYPEAARLTAMQGAELLAYPTAIGWHPEEKAQYGERQHGAWETVQRGHAVANGCFVIAVNRTGFEPDPRGAGGIEFFGQSFIAGTDGRILVRAPIDREIVIVEEIDLAEIDAVRTGWPFFTTGASTLQRHHEAVQQRLKAQASALGGRAVAGSPTTKSCGCCDQHRAGRDAALRRRCRRAGARRSRGRCLP